MPSEATVQQALQRYAHTVYRIALLRESDLSRAALATSAAFSALDWETIPLDDKLEGRLIAALPPIKRRIRRQDLLSLPPLFWRLPLPARLALGLRLQRGYTSEAIARVLGIPQESVQRILVGALAVLAGDELDTLPEACLQSRMQRLDDPGADRPHMLACQDCQAARERWAAAEQALSNAIVRATGSLMLPHATLEALEDHFHKVLSAPATQRSHRLPWLQAAVVCVVIVVTAALVLPHSRMPSAARPTSTPQESLQKALAQYGLVPAGTGILHQRYRIEAPDAATMLDGEVWTDTAQPGRYRMQISEDAHVQEWEAGDGEQSLRYFATVPDEICDPSINQLATDKLEVYRWPLDASAQAAFRLQRWQFGTWGLGRRYLEQALTASSLRSLGTTATEGAVALTLAAEGPTISGTLLLKLDVQSAMLREVREIIDDGGQTQARTVWQLLSEEYMTPEAAGRLSLFWSPPVSPQPDQIEQTMPMLDAVCPLWQPEYTYSLSKVLGMGWPHIYGLPEVPAGNTRMYLVSHTKRTNSLPYGNIPSDLTLIYAGGQRHLALTLTAGFRGQSAFAFGDSGVPAGSWRLSYRGSGPSSFVGVVQAASGQSSTRGIRIRFAAEGWSQTELEQLLATLRPLQLSDWQRQQAFMYDPIPVPKAMIDVMVPAIQLSTPAPGQIQHIKISSQYRQQPGLDALTDPYHGEAAPGSLEQWVQYGVDEEPDRVRVDARRSDGSLISVAWGDRRGNATYTVRANTVRRSQFWSTPNMASTQLSALISNVFWYGQYTVEQGSGPTLILQGTVPLSTTGLVAVQRAQRRGETGPASAGTPWLADFNPVSISYRTAFERATGRILWSETTANTATGSVMLEHTTVEQMEVLPELASEQWRYRPPLDAKTIDVSLGRQWNRQGSEFVKTIDEAIANAPTPLWGWSAGSGLEFTSAKVPSATSVSDPNNVTLDGAVAAGVAVELQYTERLFPDRTNESMSLIEGIPAQLTQILQQTPPAWDVSAQRTIEVSGKQIPAWSMHRGSSEHWLIFELDQTLIIAHYQGSDPEPMWAHFNRLSRLN